jgi:hypothetical protein
MLLKVHTHQLARAAAEVDGRGKGKPLDLHDALLLSGSAD